MKWPHNKHPLVVIALVSALVVVSLALLAGPRPEPSPAPQKKPSPSVQPKITWSEKQIEVILSPGESASRSVTFISSLAFDNAMLEPVQELAPFLTVTPGAIGSVPQNVAQPVMLDFAIAPDAVFGDYHGTVHVRTDDQVLAQTLKVVARVWRSFLDPTLGVSVKIPPDFMQSLEVDPVVFQNRAADGYRIEILRRSKEALIPLDSWILQHWFEDTQSHSLETSPLTRIADGLGERYDIQVNGLQTIILIGRSLGTQITAFILGATLDQVYVLKFKGDDLDQAEALELNIEEILQVVNTVQIL